MVERVLGKINHYFKCIPGGKFARSWLLRLERDATWNGKEVKVDVVSRHQAMWWVSALVTCMKGTPIPDPRNFVPESSVDIFTDAAGGGVGGEAEGGMGGVTWGVLLVGMVSVWFCVARCAWLYFIMGWLCGEKR